MKWRKCWRMSSCYNELCSFSNLSVTSPTSQLILQLFRRFTYVTAQSPTLPSHHLRHSSFSNPSFASPTSQALHLIYLASHPWKKVFFYRFIKHLKEICKIKPNKLLISLDVNHLGSVKSCSTWTPTGDQWSSYKPVLLLENSLESVRCSGYWIMMLTRLSLYLRITFFIV